MNAPTLIVGLGGKGSDIVLRVSKMVTEEQRKSIGFVVFDTDVNELREIKKNNSFVKTIQTSTKLSVGEYLDIDTHSRDTWFPVNAILNSKTLTEGAGQVRSISRLAFETAVKAGKLVELHEAVEDLYKLEGVEYEQSLRVIIVSSLAGGTGSGLILPVALYIRNYLATHFRQASNITRGFFLLPEVFYGVIPGQAERNNLKSNAYATLKELDAFLMKGDATLADKYKDSVKVEFPSVSTKEFEEYNVRPFDFCFLFDAQNVDGKKLNSFDEYLDHAANCIYAQSIGPMNKRSNSSEDNTIRKLVEEKGRNRYAGVGTSMLIYPNEEIKEYLALRWTKECVSEQWLTFDKMYKVRKRENAIMRRQGIRVPELSLDKCYVETVEQKAKDKDPFAEAIIRSCTKYDEYGFTKLGNKWDEYINALREKIYTENSSGQDSLDNKRSDIQLSLVNLHDAQNKLNDDSIWSLFANAYNELQLYVGMIKKHTNDSSRTIAYTIFKGASDGVVKEKLKFQLESHLRENNDFIHPTAVRYFLYKTLEELKIQRNIVKNECDELEVYFNTFEKHNFDDTETDETETVNDLSKTKKVSIVDKIRHRLSEDQEKLISNYQTYLKKADDYRVESILLAVFEEGISYVQSLSKAFEKFFDSFEDKIETVDKKILEIEKKFDHLKGTAARYVCASLNCLHTIADRNPYLGTVDSLDNELSETIYSLVRNYAISKDASEVTDYFSNIFDEGIIKYFEKEVLQAHGDLINCDIIEAIENEAKFEWNMGDSAKIEKYVIDVINETKILAAPFIEKPIGEEKNPIYSCAYNKKLNPKDDSPKSKLINKELKNFGGVEDEDIPLNQVLFYKSFYGLRANELSKFAPPSVSKTYSREAGEYYKAYFELIGQIHPEPHKSKVITPHIDRWWHTISKMPDLDEKHQDQLEKNVYNAFFWSMLNKYVDMFETEADKRTYRLVDPESLGMEEDESRLIVSNGTPCDKLYEVMDSLFIYPKLVTSIMEKVDKELDREVDENVKINNCNLLINLKRFRVKEYPIDNENQIRSIFELPLLMKKSVFKGQFSEDRVIKILKSEIHEIKNYLSNFCSEKELPKVVGNVIMEQFELFLANIEIEKDNWTDIYHDFMFTKTCNIIAKSLEELSLRKEAQIVHEKTQDLSK